MSRPAQIHFTDEQLLLLSDGELNVAKSGSTRSHLEICSICRVRLEELTTGVEAFLLFRSHVLLPALPSPLHAWEDLDGQFEGLDHPWKMKFESALGGLHSACRGLRYNMAAAAALMIIIFLIFQPWQATVSAAKLLARAIAAQSAILRSTPEPVVHQKLRIQCDVGAPGSGAPMDYESWRYVGNGRFRETISSELYSSVPSSPSDDGIGGLRRVYAVNRLDWQSPLSAEAYQRWSAGRGSVARARGDSSQPGLWLIMTTLATPTPQGDEIGQAQFVVRASDWHPVAVRLSLRDRHYEIREISYRVVPLSQVDSSLFDSTTPGADQVKSPKPGNALRNIHEGKRRSSAVIGTRNQERNDFPSVPQPQVMTSTGGNAAAAELGAGEAETSLNPPLTLRFAASASSGPAVPVRPRLNLSWAHPPVTLDPRMAFAEQLARQQEVMQQALTHPSRLAAPAPRGPREKTKEKNSRRSGK
jgi:hypothetical protein